MTKFTCDNCGTKSALVKGMTTCPACQSEIDEMLLGTLDVSDLQPEIMGSIDTAKGGSTISSDADPDQMVEHLGTASDRTMMAAELGYADQPLHMKTVELPESAYESAFGRSSSIPHRTVADDETSKGEFQDYKLIDKLGSGSFGVVYRALQVPLDRNVAIKILRPLSKPAESEGQSSRQRREFEENRIREGFLREAQFTGKLEHPNIVPIHDIGLLAGKDKGDRPFYVMKEIKGISWQDVIKEKTRDENMDIFERVVDAIGFAHSNNILHCDLKPENVMLGEFGEVLVVDWGQAIDVTRPETFRPGGSPAYCSPEMASYWCNVNSDGGKAEAAKREIGPRSDVYLLGAILFQIVTGKPPHFGLPGESAADVMFRASKNEIRKYDDFQGDELLHIALDCLRLESRREIATVAQLKDALKSYESRRQSIELRDRAFQLLDEARDSSDYDTYQKAKFGFEESLQLWPENPTAQQGLEQTRLSCATLALNDQNFDLGLDMLNVTSTREEEDVKGQLQVGKRKRDNRKSLIRLLSLLFLLFIVVATSISLYLINKANTATAEAADATEKVETAKVDLANAEEQKKQADERRKEADEKAKLADEKAIAAGKKAEEANKLAEQANRDAEQANKLAEAAKKDVIAANKAVENANSMAEKARGDAQKAEKEAQKKVMAANQSVKEAQKAEQAAAERTKEIEEGSELLKYKATVSAIAQRANAEDFYGTQSLLSNDELDVKTIDWRRLNLLAHPEVTAVSRFPKEDLFQAEFSRNRNRLALSFADRVEICDVQDLNQPVKTIPMALSDDVPIALNASGTVLAVGRRGKLQVFDVVSGQMTSEKQAQSNKIFDIDFSADGKRLVSVGDPDPRFLNVAADSKQRQLALMIWAQRDGNQWELMQRPKFDGEPAAPIAAQFSEDGNRILLTNKARSLDQQLALVMKLAQSDNATFYKLESKSPVSGVVTSIFAESSGSTIVSSVATNTSNSLMLWSVDNQQDLASLSGESSQFVSLTKSSRAVRRNRLKGATLKSENVESRIEDLDLQGDVIAAVSANKKLTVWDLGTDDLLSSDLSNPEIYGGHARPVVRCGIVGGTGELITIANGINPEILKISRQNFVQPNLRVSPVGQGAKLVDQSSPTVTFECGTNGILMGNDHGLVSYTRNLNQPNQSTLKWQVTAWQQQWVTPQFLFAQSQRDLIYKYNLESGELVEVYTQLSEVIQGVDRSGKIKKMVVSEDGSTIALQRANGKNEIEVWNLAQKTKSTIDYSGLTGLVNDDSDNVKILPQMALSPNGALVAAGKVRFHVWDVASKRDLDSDKDLAGFNGSNLSSLRFVADRQLLAGQRKTIRLFEVNDSLTLAANFAGIEGLPELINEPNVVSTRFVNGQLHAIIRKSFELESGEGDSATTACANRNPGRAI